MGDYTTKTKMKGYEIIRSIDVLRILRRKGPPLVHLLTFGFLLCLFLVVPIANILFYHYLVWGSAWFVLFWIALISPFLIRDILYLRGKVVILDKRRDQVHVNGKCMCALTEVRAVRLGSYIKPTAKDLPFKIHALYLETTKGEAVEIERGTDFGSGYKEVGLAIADFAQVKSNISKE